MRSSVFALALPLVAALPHFPPTNGPAAAGGLVKRWKLNTLKDSKIELTPADVDLYKKMGWTSAQILHLDPNAPAGTQQEHQPQASSPTPVITTPGGDPLDRDTDIDIPSNESLDANPLDKGILVDNRIGDLTDDQKDGTQQLPQDAPPPEAGKDDGTQQRPQDTRPEAGKADLIDAGNKDAASSSTTTDQDNDWLAIANEIRQSLEGRKLPLLQLNSTFQAGATKRSKESASADKYTLTHSSDKDVLGYEVMHFGKSSEFREVFWGWLCEMPKQLRIEQQCAKVTNTRNDITGHAEAVTNPDFTQIGCGHAPSDYFGGQWTCVLR